MKSVLVWVTVVAALAACESKAKKPATEAPLPPAENSEMMGDAGMQPADASMGGVSYDAPPPEGMDSDDAGAAAQVPPEEAPPEVAEPPATPAQTREAEQAVDDVVAKFENLAASVEQASPQCDQVAAAINEWSAANRQDVESAAEKVVALPSDDQEQILSDFQQRMHPVGQRIDRALGVCKDDPQVVNALESLGHQ